MVFRINIHEQKLAVVVAFMIQRSIYWPADWQTSPGTFGSRLSLEWINQAGTTVLYEYKLQDAGSYHVIA